jgi:hypothetical protein
MSAVLMNRRHGRRGAVAGRQRRRRQLRWDSDQGCAVDTERTRGNSGLTWQRLRRKLMARTHKTASVLRKAQAVVQPAYVACSQSTPALEDSAVTGQWHVQRTADVCSQ